MESPIQYSNFTKNAKIKHNAKAISCAIANAFDSVFLKNKNNLYTLYDVINYE